MRRLYTLSLTVLLLAAAVALAAPGPCGDIDDNESEDVTLGDITAFQDYFFLGGTLAQPADADCDGKEGITIADLVALMDNLMGSAMSLDCSASGRYDYTLIPQDTIIMPMARCIEPTESSVTLDVKMHIHSNNLIVYLPFDAVAPGSSGNFVYAGSTGPVTTDVSSGTPVIFGSFSGNDVVHLQYNRVGAGFGEIHTGMVDINTHKRYAVATGFWTGNIDLRRPVVLYCWQYDYPEGDMDCDCLRSLGDLTNLISGLFITLTWPSPCPCGF